MILTTYLDDLDFSRSYFLASDIANFEKYRTTLDDALKSANLQPAYDIFNLYLRRLVDRTAAFKPCSNRTSVSILTETRSSIARMPVGANPDGTG